MTLRAHHYVVSLLAAAVVLSGFALLTVSPSGAQAACATGSSVVITNPTSPTGNIAAVQGIFTLKAHTTPTTASGLTYMLLSSSGQQPIGGATQSGSDWVLTWDTRNNASGSYQLIAIAHFGTATTLDCASPGVYVNISNNPTQAPQLKASISPNTWQGPAGATAPFAVDTVYTDQYGRSSHVGPVNLNWHSPLGVANPPNAPSTVFQAGTVLGSGILAASVSYNGLTYEAVANVKILSPTTTSGSGSGPAVSPTPSPAPAAGTTGPVAGPTPAPLTQAEAAKLAAMPTIFRPASPTNSDPTLSLPALGCLEKAVGSVRFAEISSGKSQPTAAERKQSAGCFVGAERIPAILAPVAPAHIDELNRTSDIVTIAKIENQTVKSANAKAVNGLRITGKGAPNSSVFIYIFSDPLVLRAQTDGSGTWQYVLESPLPGGKHEVYAVAEKDSATFVRTSAVPISIASAASGGQDGRLVVESGWSAPQIGFAAAAAAMVLAALGVIFTVRRRRRNATAGAADVTSVPAPAQAPAPAPSLSTPPSAGPSVQPSAAAPDQRESTLSSAEPGPSDGSQPPNHES
jgi:hypothetical protein